MNIDNRWEQIQDLEGMQDAAYLMQYFTQGDAEPLDSITVAEYSSIVETVRRLCSSEKGAVQAYKLVQELNSIRSTSIPKTTKIEIQKTANRMNGKARQSSGIAKHHQHIKDNRAFADDFAARILPYAGYYSIHNYRPLCRYEVEILRGTSKGYSIGGSINSSSQQYRRACIWHYNDVNGTGVCTSCDEEVSTRVLKCWPDAEHTIMMVCNQCKKDPGYEVMQKAYAGCMQHRTREQANSIFWPMIYLGIVVDYKDENRPKTLEQRRGRLSAYPTLGEQFRKVYASWQRTTRELLST